MNLRTVIGVGLLVTGTTLGLLTFSFARAHPAYSLVDESDLRAAAELAAGWALLAAALIISVNQRRTRFAALAVAASFGWFLAEWNNPELGSAFVFTIGLLLFAVAPPLVAHATLSYPAGRLTSWLDRAGLAAAYAGALLLLGLFPVLVFDPSAQVCTECPRNLLLLVHDSSDRFRPLNRIGIDAGLGWSLALIVLLTLQLARATSARRRLVWPVSSMAAVYLAFVSWEFAHSLGRGSLSNDPTDRNLRLAQACALIALAASTLWDTARHWGIRKALASLVVDRTGSPAPRDLRELLVATLGDASLQIAYPLRDGRLVDADGNVVGLEGDVTPIVRDDETVALLSHRPGLLDDPRLVEEIAAAAHLALANERLQAEARAQLDDLRASRARIIESGDAERRRLERDLHDGAQQQLVGLSLALRLARAHLGSEPDPAVLARFDEAESELRAAFAELRELAHGIFPAVLAEEGLSAALEALVEEVRIPIELSALPDERFDAAVEAAGYFVVSETATRRPAGALRVSATRIDGCLVVEVEGEGAPEQTVDLEDRVGALNGSVEVVRNDEGRVTIRAEIPCES
jgi:signal transduction histidine kinase